MIDVIEGVSRHDPLRKRKNENCKKPQTPPPKFPLIKLDITPNK